ncbi:MAG: AzlC family ABC transporter permease [Pygmaiobacter massiliensis]|nr:AzlC family ABC transporter permease [Pygmaiobacter massiliensis]
MARQEYTDGLKECIPVAVGYFSVSFGFGAVAVNQGLSALQATLISLTNMTSAGQFAGLTVIAAAASLVEMVLTQLVINSRYALMSLALSQKMSGKIGLGCRLIFSFYNTDEVFALAMARKKPLTSPYLMGLGTLAVLGWTGGTLAGALASAAMPGAVRTALGVALYGMFIAIVVPQARQEKPILAASLLAIAASCLFSWVPALQQVSAGLAIVISTVAAAGICAVLFPVQDPSSSQEVKSA